MSWSPKFQPPEKQDTYNILFRLQFILIIGVIIIIVYASRSWSAQSDGVTFPEALGVGVVGAGASLLAGFLLGFIFCIPRTPSRHDSTASAASGAGATVSAAPTVVASASSAETNSNLVEISDWLTKIIVGVGLVELSKIPTKLDSLAKFFAAGLRSCQTPTTATTAATVSNSCLDSTKAFALGIIIFFATCGFLFGYLWTRLYWQRALNDLDRVKEEVGGIGAWVYVGISRLYTGLGTWKVPAPVDIEEASLDRALVTLDRGLTKYPSVILHIEKALVLRAYAMKKTPPDSAKLEKAVSESLQAAKIDPDDMNAGVALYNAACYQALLGKSADLVLDTLESAIKKDSTKKEKAKLDPDFPASLKNDPRFQKLTD